MTHDESPLIVRLAASPGYGTFSVGRDVYVTGDSGGALIATAVDAETAEMVATVLESAFDLVRAGKSANAHRTRAVLCAQCCDHECGHSLCSCGDPSCTERWRLADGSGDVHYCTSPFVRVDHREIRASGRWLPW